MFAPAPSFAMLPRIAGALAVAVALALAVGLETAPGKLSIVASIAACVMALAAAIRRKHGAMLVWFGLAIGLDPQALLFAPFVVAVTLNRRVPLRLWPVAPLVAGATMLPGLPTSAIASDLFRLADPAETLAFDAPNLWAIVQALPWIGALPMVGLAFAAAIGATAAYIARFSVQYLGPRQLSAAALLSALLTAGLLPRLHDSAFLLADVLAVALVLTLRDAASCRIAALILLGSGLALCGPIAAMLGAAAMIATTLELALPLLNRAANDNPLLVRVRTDDPAAPHPDFMVGNPAIYVSIRGLGARQ